MKTYREITSVLLLLELVLIREIEQNLEQEKIISALHELILKENKKDCYDIIKEHPELLSKEADSLLLTLINSQIDEDAQNYLKLNRFLLQKCRESGIDSVFGDRSFNQKKDSRSQIFSQTRKCLNETMNATNWVGKTLRQACCKIPRFKTLFRLKFISDTKKRPLEENNEDVSILEILIYSQQALNETKKFENDKSLDSLNNAIQIWENIITNPETKKNPELYTVVLDQVASLLLTRYQIYWDKRDLDYAVLTLRQSIDFVFPNSPLIPSIYNSFGASLILLYYLTDNLTDLEDAIANCRKSVSLTDPNSHNLPMCLNNLANGLTHLYSHTHERKDLEEAIDNWKQAISLSDFNSLELSSRLNNLSICLENRYSLTGDLKDLEEAIVCYRKAISLTVPNSLELSDYLDKLGQCLVNLYSIRGELKYIEEAIVCYRKAISLTDLNSPKLPAYLNNFGTSLSYLYSRIGDLKDLEEAISSFKKAISFVNPKSPDLSKYLNNLGNDLNYLFARTSDLKDLEEAIYSFKEAISIADSNSPDLPSIYTSLGNSLNDFYLFTGDLKDLEEAIDNRKKAVYLADPKSPDLPIYFNNLGNGLNCLYSQTYDLKDLEEAISNLKNSISFASPNWPFLPITLDNLGSSLRYKYLRTHDLKDLEEAIENHRNSLSLVGPDSPYLPSILNNFGNDFEEKYSITGDLNDLNESISNYNKSVSILTPDSPELPGYLNNLGNGLKDLYLHTNNVIHLQKAIDIYKKTIFLAPNSPNFPLYLNNLGTGLRELYSITGNLKDLKEAFDNYSRARDYMDRLFSQVRVAYKLGQRNNLGEVDTNIVRTALMLKKASSKNDGQKWSTEAMISAERAKSKLLNEFISRSGLSAPSWIDPDLVKEEAQVVSMLVSIDFTELANRGLLNVSDKAFYARTLRFEERDELIQKLNGLWSQMESLGGEAVNFVNFRKGVPPSWEIIHDLSKEVGNDSAILSMFKLEKQIVLFVIRSEWDSPKVFEISIDTENLIGLVFEFYMKIREQNSDFDEIFNNIRKTEHWDDPLSSLIKQTAVELDGVKRVIFSPHNFGHILPWAAIAKNANLDIDWVTVPALESLNRVMHLSCSITVFSLVVGNPTGDLKYAEEEAKIVADQLHSKAILDSRATKEIVMKILPEARIAHFSAHAYFNPSNPLDSGILLANGILTAREIMTLGARPELLVLSACETGMTTPMGGDEWMGLSQVFLQAGAKSLLVSLWKVDDEATAFLMNNFYDFWLKGCDKAEALSKAMDETKLKWPDIYYWGAFNLVGDWR